MADYTPQTSTHRTLAAATVDSVLLQSFGAVIQVIHRDGASTTPIYFTTGPTVAATTAPTVAGDNTFVVLPGSVANVPWPTSSDGAKCAVKLISAATDPYSVQVITARAF